MQFSKAFKFMLWQRYAVITKFYVRGAVTVENERNRPGNDPLSFRSPA